MEECLCTSLVENIFSALTLRPLANSTVCGDALYQWLTPAQGGLAKLFTVTEERKIVNNKGNLY
jgi:hypothetical protein